MFTKPRSLIMRDPISIDRCKLLHPKVRDEASLIITLAELGFPSNIKIRIVQGLRAKEEQIALYAQGRTKPGKIVTKAQWFQTFHFYGLSLDFAIMYDKDSNGTFETLSWDTALDFDKDGIIDWNEVTNLFEAKGWIWGGKFRTFKDMPHVQKTFGYGWRDLFAKYEAKDFISGTEYVNI